ncbi:MAG: bifunctional DNA-binding transcriptional regulator/O6-methylguanine-DNA methyltransferase Ada [Pseudomonadota bacterium]
MAWTNRAQHAAWLAKKVAAREADGDVYIGVITTGIYCLPECSARPPRPENVRFFSSLADARHAGFRPCKRCRPDEAAQTQRVLTACTAMAEAPGPVALSQLARSAGVSASQFQRSFKAVLGITPKAYGLALRRARLADALHQEPTVTAALYAAGYESAARFYETAADTLGMAPSVHKAGGPEQKVYFAVAETELGSLLAARTMVGLCALALGDDAEALLKTLQERYPKAMLAPDDDVLHAWLAATVSSIREPEKARALPLDIRGTAFQQRVWTALRAIPPGETKTYAQIAADIGAPKAVRAVASACAANKHALAIPCHRVIRTDGGLGGYRWGIARKRALLLREKVGKTKDKPELSG